MISMPITFPVRVAFAGIVLISCTDGQFGRAAQPSAISDARSDDSVSVSFVYQTIRPSYLELLAQFDENDQGKGLDHFNNVTASQPMTYGLVLSSEATRYRKVRSDEGARRIKQAVRWLIENRDLDQDGKPGWGLPQAWDTFADGTENPPNTPYTITTAIVVEGLLEALAIENFWTTAEQDEILTLIKRVVSRWCNELWAEGFGGGFFRYSMYERDAVFSVNAPTMYLGAMVRLLNEHGKSLNEAERSLIENRTHALAIAIIGTAELRGDLPFWLYTPRPNKLNAGRPNDLLHHAYILWGIEAYRDFAPDAKFTWSREQALKSLDTFWRDNVLYDFATSDCIGKPAQAKSPPRLWGTGMALAVYAKYGSAEQTERITRELLRQHGPLPNLRRTSSKSEKPAFYRRHAAHALFGLAHAGYEK